MSLDVGAAGRPMIDRFAPTPGARAGVSLLIAGGWFAPMFSAARPFPVGPIMAVIGFALLVAGLVLVLKGPADERGRSALFGIGASLAVGVGYLSFQVFPFGPLILVAPPILGVAIWIFAARSPLSTNRAASSFAIVGGVLAILGSAVFAAYEGFIWYVEAFLPDVDVAGTYAYLRPDELESVRNGAISWVVGTVVILVAFTVWAIVITFLRRGGVRRVGAVALSCVGVVLVGMNLGSFSVGWNVTDYLSQPEDYVGYSVRQMLVSLSFAGASLLAFWPSRAATAQLTQMPVGGQP